MFCWCAPLITCLCNYTVSKNCVFVPRSSRASYMYEVKFTLWYEFCDVSREGNREMFDIIFCSLLIGVEFIDIFCSRAFTYIEAYLVSDLQKFIALSRLCLRKEKKKKCCKEYIVHKTMNSQDKNILSLVLLVKMLGALFLLNRPNLIIMFCQKKKRKKKR